MAKLTQIIALFQKSPTYALKRISGAIKRRLAHKVTTLKDQRFPTFQDKDIRLSCDRLDLASHWISQNPQTKEHVFDLLGSGPVDLSASAFETPINPANRIQSAEIFAQIGKGDFAHTQYRQIDWQLDFKSGYRWRADMHFMGVPYGHRAGVDIKVPWELSRLQHLPRLVLSSLKTGDKAFLIETRAQILDFIAHNPPRFGVNWRCPMDVGIRCVNLVMAYRLMLSAGLKDEGRFERILGNALQAHVDHIVAYPEWSENARGNHYMANIMGLLFGASILPGSKRNRAILAFAIQEFLIETERQFLDDGASFEGSTGYHRLSSEMVYWGAALILGLPENVVKDLVDYDHTSLRVRPPFLPVEQKKFTIFENRIVLDQKLATLVERSSDFIRDTQLPDGQWLKIGDYDSGRLLKATLPLCSYGEDILNHGAAIELADALLGRKTAGEGYLLSALTGGRTLEGARTLKSEVKVAELELTSFDIIEEDIEISLKDSIDISYYPDFGLYIWRSDDFMLTLRCHNGKGLREWGHFHDDNLSITLFNDGHGKIVDPGSYLYTADRAQRKAYQQISVHYAPRLEECPAMSFGPSLFEARPLASGRCLSFGPDGGLFVLGNEHWSLARELKITSNRIEITDISLTCGKKLVRNQYNSEIRDTLGYGRKSERPIYSV